MSCLMITLVTNQCTLVSMVMVNSTEGTNICMIQNKPISGTILSFLINSLDERYLLNGVIEYLRASPHTSTGRVRLTNKTSLVQASRNMCNMNAVSPDRHCIICK